MDPSLSLLASTAAILLRDALPHLEDLAGSAARKMLETVAGEKAKEVAAVLGLLKGKAEGKRIPVAALEDLKENPADTEALETLQGQIAKWLERDGALRGELLAKLEGVDVRVAERGLAVLGDLSESQVVTGDGNLTIRVSGGNVYVVQAPAVTAATPAHAAGSRAELRRRYLEWVLRTSDRVPLGAVDPRLSPERQLHLEAVYTALRTTTPRRSEKGEREMARESEPPYSALEMLDLHERLVVLGDPGSGKSTFVAWVAHCLAEAGLGEGSEGLELLTSPLPQDDGSEGEERQPWRHGSLLPVRVVLRDFAARGLGAAAERATESDVLAFLAQDLADHDLAEVASVLKEALQRGEALVLFDGLDEVPEALERRQLICSAVELFAQRYSRSRVLVTSRSYAYQKQKFRLRGFEAAELAPFGEGQIRRFIRRWYVERAGLEDWREEEARARGAQLERAIFASERIHELAERPLLLTLMASLHATRGSLPEDRAKLYGDTVDLLLDVWEERRRPQGREGQPEPSLTAWLGCDRAAVRRAIEELAYEAHASQPEREGTADLDEAKLVGRLQLCSAQGADSRELVDYLRDRAGILEARGVGVYTFPHRTFQEYLAACHLTSGSFDDEKVADLARGEPERWREVVLLAAAKLGGAARWNLIAALCFRGVEKEAEPADEWGALLAGQAAAESPDRGQLSERNGERLEMVRRWQVRLLESAVLPASERARAGESLAQLGDSRFEAAAPHLPVDEPAGFVKIPGGRYVMGSREDDPDSHDDEKPQHEVDLSTFYLARYPVTVAQFRAFVEATGFELGDRDALAGVANHPVVWVSWDEAMAYCDWLSEQLRAQVEARLGGLSGEAAELWEQVASGALRASLPSEAQWEAAARGEEGRRYPWGADVPTPEHANFSASELGGPTSVGIYPQGRGRFGLDDQAGNVWEWCRDEWFEGAYGERDGSPNPVRLGTAKSENRVVRGGSWANGPRNLRAAFRLRYWSWYRNRHQGFRVVLCPSPEP